MVRIFVGWRKGSGVRGFANVGVEGGVRGVTWGWPAKKKKEKRFLFDLGEKLKKARKGIEVYLFVYP